jgi:hypothetical protein
MRMSKDKQSRINLYFLSIVLLAGFIVLGLNIYKNIRYSRFDLFVVGKSTLEYAPLSLRNPPIISPSSSNNQTGSYDHLAISWWGDKDPAYKIDDAGLWFQVTPTIRGSIELNNPQAGTPLMIVGYDIRDQ